MADKIVAERIRNIREIHGISYCDAANKIGIGESTLVQIETGRYPVSSDQLIKICKFFGVSSDYILGLTDINTTHYRADIRELYVKSYEKYLIFKKCPDYFTEYSIKGKKPIADWPYNLLEACEFDMDFPISDIQYEGLKEVIDNKLPKREAIMVCAYYMKHMTLEQLSDEFEVTKERIRQIILNGVRKIKHPARANLIRYGVDYAKTNAEMRALDEKLSEIEKKKEIIKEFDKKQQERFSEAIKEIRNDPMNTSLIDLNLSVRSYNCLARAAHYVLYKDVNLVNAYDIVKLFQSGDIIKIRNLGRKSCEEIRNKLVEIGIPAEELTENSEVVLEAGA